MAFTDFYPVTLALFAAAASGLVGSFALMKRMTIAGDVISHIALPGLGLALLMKANPLVGAAATLTIGMFLIWHLEKRTNLSAETAIGVMFAASVAIGALITPEGDIIDALFGGFPGITAAGFALGIAATLGIILFILAFKDKLIIALFSPELAISSGINLNRLNLYFLLIFALTVLTGLQFLGGLLMGALIIIPAAIGRQLTHTLSAFLFASAAASVASVAIGFFLASRWGFSLGPAIVTVAAFLFAISLLKKKK